MDKIEAAVIMIQQEGSCLVPIFIACNNCLIDHQICRSENHSNRASRVQLLKKILSEKYTVGEIAEAIL